MAEATYPELVEGFLTFMYDPPMLSRFALTIWRASTDRLAYVDDFAKRRTGSGLGYLYWLCLTISFFALLPIAIGLAFITPRAEKFANDQLTILQNWYPDDLVVTISGGVLSTNRKERVVLDLPQEWQMAEQWTSDMDDENEWPTHAISIDTAASVDDFESFDTFILLTKTSMVAKDDNGLRIYRFAEIDDNMVVNEAHLADIVGDLREVTPALPWIGWIGVFSFILVIPWILGGIVWALNLLFLLWGTLIIQLFASIVGRHLPYKTLYRLGLFGLTSSILASFAIEMTSLPLAWVPWALFCVWMGAIVTVFPRSAPKPRSVPLPPAATMKKAPKKPTKKR